MADGNKQPWEQDYPSDPNKNPWEQDYGGSVATADEEEERLGHAPAHREELPGATPRLKAATGGKALKPVTGFEKSVTGKGPSEEGIGGEIWEGAKGVASGIGSILDPTRGLSGAALTGLGINPRGGDVSERLGEVPIVGAYKEAKAAYQDPRTSGLDKATDVALAPVGAMLGLSSSASREAGFAGEGGKVLGQAAVPVGAAIAGEVAPHVIPPVARTAAKTIKKVGEPFHIGMTGEELLKKGVSPRAQATGWDDAIARPGVQRAIKEAHAASPIRTAADLDEAIPGMKDKIWDKKVEPALARQGPRPVDMQPAAKAVRDVITPEMREFDPTGATDLEDVASKLERSRTVAETNGLLKYINGKLESYFAKYPSARRANLMNNPETAGWEAARRAIRNQFLDTLEGAGETQIRNARQDYGALETIGKEVERRVNVADRAKPWSLTRIFGWGAAPFTHGITAGLGELAHHLNKPDVLIRRGISRLKPGEEPAFTAPPAYEVPPVRNAGSLPAPATPMPGPVDLEGTPIEGGRWVTPKGALPGIQPIVPKFLREIPAQQPEAAPAPPVRGALPSGEPPATTIPPIVEEPFAREEVRPPSTAGERAPETQLGPMGRAGIRQRIKAEIPEEAESTFEVINPKGKGTLSRIEPKGKGIKPIPVEKRFTGDQIADAEGLLASESGAMLSADKPGVYFDEIGQMDRPELKERPKEGVRRGGRWRGVTSGRNMYPFMRENPDLSPSEVQKALRNKDSAAYNRLITKAVDFIRRQMDYENIRRRGENPDAEPE